jgi:hypothetical protein
MAVGQLFSRPRGGHAAAASARIASGPAARTWRRIGIESPAAIRPRASRASLATPEAGFSASGRRAATACESRSTPRELMTPARRLPLTVPRAVRRAKGGAGVRNSLQTAARVSAQMFVGQQLREGRGRLPWYRFLQAVDRHGPFRRAGPEIAKRRPALLSFRGCRRRQPRGHSARIQLASPREPAAKPLSGKSRGSSCQRSDIKSSTVPAPPGCACGWPPRLPQTPP